MIAGEGDAFCAGLDFASVLRQPARIATSFVPRPWRGTNTFQEACWAWRRLPVPVDRGRARALPRRRAADRAGRRLPLRDARLALVGARGQVGDHPRHVRHPEPGPAGRHRHRQAAHDDRRDAHRRPRRTSSAWSPGSPTTRWPPPPSSSSSCGCARPTSSPPPSGSSTTPGPPAPGVPSPASGSSRPGCWSPATPRSPARRRSREGRSGVRPPGSMRFQRTARPARASRPAVLARARALGAARPRWRRCPCRGCGRGCGPTWRVTAVVVAAALALAGLVVLVPDGWLPIPPGPGRLVTPGYVGRPAAERPIRMDVPQHPHLAPNGASSMHDDAWATDTYPWAGPARGVAARSTPRGSASRSAPRWPSTPTTGWSALCGDLHGPTLHVIDPRLDEPGRDQGAARPPGHRREAVGGPLRRRLLLPRRRATTPSSRPPTGGCWWSATADAEGDPDLTTEASYDLGDAAPRATTA